MSYSLVYHLNKESPTPCNKESIVINHIKDIFRRSRNNYGIRKIKVELEKIGYKVSRRRISRIMEENSLVSNYTVTQYKIHTTNCNEPPIPNIVDINFNNREKLEVAVSDLTYVRIAGEWNYVRTLIYLYNREIIDYAAGTKKDAKLIETALLRCKYSLKDIKLFHSDRECTNR